MRVEQSIDAMLADATRAVEYAQGVRQYHAKHTKRGSRQRKIDIDLALGRIKQAMKPIRRYIAQLPYLTNDLNSKTLRQASKSLQIERRKLWKMKPNKKRRKN